MSLKRKEYNSIFVTPLLNETKIETFLFPI